MAYMVMQRYTTAIREGYADRTGVAAQLAAAGQFRAWLEALTIDPAVRAELVEPIQAIETAFGDLLRAPDAYRRR